MAVAVDPSDVVFYTRVVERWDLEVIGSVDDDIVGDELLDIRVVDIGNDGLDGYPGVDLGKACLRRDGFWQAFGGVGLFDSVYAGGL